MTDISVCIPAYNCAGTVARAVASVLSQDVRAEVEILICDDGSTDRTLAVLKDLQAQHPQIRILENTTNMGRPYTRNRLLHAAAGTYLTWLDADDEKYQGMLAAQHSMLEDIRITEGADSLDRTLVFTNFHWLWPDMDRPKRMSPPESDYHMEHLLNASFGGYLWLMMGTARTFRTVGDFDVRLPRLQDLDFFIRFIQKGGVMRRVGSEDPFCIYYKDDRARGAMAVWKSWNRIWDKHRLLFYSYGYDNAAKWRRHHYRVTRRFAKADNNWPAHALIAVRELLFLARQICAGRLTGA